MGERRVLADASWVALTAADLVATLAAEAIAARDSFRLGVSGGRTPEAAYRLLASPEFRARLPRNKVHVLFADERDAPPTEPESNYWLVRKLFVEPAGIPPENVHRMKADGPDLDAAASAYEPLLAGARKVHPDAGPSGAAQLPALLVEASRGGQVGGLRRLHPVGEGETLGAGSRIAQAHLAARLEVERVVVERSSRATGDQLRDRRELALAHGRLQVRPRLALGESIPAPALGQQDVALPTQ